MRRDVFTIRDDQSVEELVHLLVREHIHGCPVVDKDGFLVGMVTQQDVFFAGVSRPREEQDESAKDDAKPSVADLMTSPAVSATEETEVLDLCRMMRRLRIHRIPIINDGKLSGIISALDIVGQLAQGRTDL
jgi:CBS domain-containing protein